MDAEMSPRNLCEEIGGEVREMAQWLSSGQLTADQFRVALLTLESKKVQRYGFRLTGEQRGGGRTHFELRFAKDDRLCATLDFDSGAQDLRVEHVCG